MARQDKKIAEVVEDYLDYRRARVASATWKQESYVFRRLARDLPDIQIRHLTGDHVGAWFFGPNGILVVHLTGGCRSREPVTAATANYYRTRLAGLFKYTAQRGLTHVALLDDVPVQPEVRRVRQQPPPAVLLELPNHMDNDRDRAFIATAINSGMRSSEITGLRLSDVDLDAGYLRVVVRKTHEEDRFPITGDLDPELRRWLTAYAESMPRPLRGDDYLFPAHTGTRYKWITDETGEKIQTRTVGAWRPDRPVCHTERIVHRALKAVGLPTYYEGTHTLRRAIARATFDDLSSRKDGGHDSALRDVMAMLHHASSKTTEIYLGVTAEKQRRDDRMRGRPFLSAMVEKENVVSLHAASAG